VSARKRRTYVYLRGPPAVAGPSGATKGTSRTPTGGLWRA